MEVDPEDVKRHLEILGYTHIEPYLLNEFVKDLKKLIEYDRKHNVSALSSSLAKDWEQSYSDRMKTNTANERAVDQNCQIASADKREFGQNEKQKNNTLSTSMSSTTKNQYSDKVSYKNCIPTSHNGYSSFFENVILEDVLNFKETINNFFNNTILIGASV